MHSGHSINSPAPFATTALLLHPALCRIHTWLACLKASTLSIFSAWKLLLALASPSQQDPLFKIAACPFPPLISLVPVPFHILFFSIIMYHHLIYKYSCFYWNVIHMQKNAHIIWGQLEKLSQTEYNHWPSTRIKKLGVISIPGGPCLALLQSLVK